MRTKRTIWNGFKICLSAALALSLCACVPSGRIYDMASLEYKVETSGVNIEDVIKNTAEDNSYERSNRNGIPAKLIADASYVSVHNGKAETIHFLDAGNGMACFIVDKGHVIIVGTGAAEYREKVAGYLNRLSPTDIDIVLPGISDNTAGNASYIIGKYHDRIGRIVIPPFNSAKDDVGNEMMDAVEKYGLKVMTPDDAKMFDLNGITGIVYRPYTSLPTDHAGAETIVSVYSGNEQIVFECTASGKKEDEIIKYHSFDRTTPILALYKMAAEGEWTERFYSNYYLTAHEDDSVRKILLDRNINFIDTANMGTVVFSYSEFGVTVKTRVSDTDNSSDYNEKETSDAGFRDEMVVVDDIGVIHRNMNCDSFKGDTARGSSLSDALSVGKKLCDRCMSDVSVSEYESWSKRQTDGNILE